jgi:hypothetical protein
MTGSRSMQKIGGRRRRRSGKRQRGGMDAPSAGSYTSAAGYGMAVNGTGPEQFARTFEGPGSGPGIYKSVQGASVGGGRKRSKKGGFWGEIVSQALVPFSILGMQQTYRRNKHGGKRTKRRR